MELESSKVQCAEVECSEEWDGEEPDPAQRSRNQPLRSPCGARR